MSRHGRRGQGEDDQWGPGDYPPQDADEPVAPGDYGQVRRDWSRNPIATADSGDFPAANSSLPPASYPRDYGGRPSEAFDWGPDPLGLQARGDAQDSQPWGAQAQDSHPRGLGGRGFELPGGGPADQPRPEPMAPDRWAPPSWESPSWDRASWDSEPAGSAGWLDPPAGHPDWAEHGDPLGAAPGGFGDPQAGELPPLPPGPLSGSGHPSGPLPPLPDSDYRWGELPPDPPPAASRSRWSGRDQEQPRRRSRHGASGPSAAGYPQDPAGYPQDPAGYPQDPAGYTEDHARYAEDPGGYPDEHPGYSEDPGGYAEDPGSYRPEREETDYPGSRGRGRWRRGAEPHVGLGHPGYEGYVDDPRDLEMAPDQGQEPADYDASGGWYPGEDEPHAWAGDPPGSDLLPGLDPEQVSRRGAGGGSGGTARKKRRRVRAILLAILAVFVLLVVAVGGVGYHYYKEYINPPDFSGAGTGSVVVQILPGQFASQIGLTLAGDGVVASARAFSNAAKANPQGNALQPGYYRVHRHMKASLAVALLLKPSSRVQSKITIPEGFRVAEIIALLGKQTGNLKGYQQAIAHPAGLGLPPFAHGKPEGYLFPATYEIPPKTSPTGVLQMMVNQFKQNAQNTGLQAASARARESEAAVITVASIIQAEGKRPQDFSKIAEVIYNRLNMNPPMKLELDTTVLYGMGLAHKNGFSTTFPSPYNTYLHAGLPPGPIDNPGNTAIQAALHPDHGGLLYFLTINSTTGNTLFFSNATAFNAAVQQYGSTGAGTGSRTGSG